MSQGEKRIDQIEVGDLVQLPHSDAFWPVLWTQLDQTVSEPYYFVKVRGVTEPFRGPGDQLLPCYIFNH